MAPPEPIRQEPNPNEPPKWLKEYGRIALCIGVGGLIGAWCLGGWGALFGALLGFGVALGE